MIWLLPRSDPEATDTYLRPGRCGVSAPTARLPHGPLPRLFMLWLYAECARDAQGDLERQYSLADYLLALEFEQRAMPELAGQTERLFACRFRAGEEVIPVTRASTSRPPGGARDRLPALTPLRTRHPDLSDELREEMASRRLSPCLHTLRAVQHCPFALDVYLWDRCYGDGGLRGAPPARSRLARYHALADHPSPWPAPDEVRAFEHDLAKVREALRRLRNEAHPPEDFDDDIPF